MCRASDSFFPGYSTASPQTLRIASVYVRFPGGQRGQRFPKSLTLVYLPRISEAGLEIDGTRVRPDIPAFVTLHRIRDDDGVSYGCRDKVRAGAGLRFEVYLGEEKILKGTFRKAGKGWKVECRCAMEMEWKSAVREGDVVEVLVGVDGVGGGRDGIREMVRMAARRRSRRGEGNGFRNELEEIPEDGEAEGEWYDDTSSGEPCSCCGGSDGCGEEGGEDEDEDEDEEDYEAGEDWDEVNTEGVKWAVDVGIWVFCLGVGLLVSRASSKKLRRRRRLI